MTAAATARKRLPPYAKPLAEARKKGFVPDLGGGFFIVALGWGAYDYIRDRDDLPCIVLPLDFHLQEYDLRPLAGLSVAILYEGLDSWRLNLVFDALWNIRLDRLAMISTLFVSEGGCLDDGYDQRVYTEWPPRN